MNINPFNRANPLSWKDAAIISAISATATYVLTFLVNASYGQVIADPGSFAFDSLKLWLAGYFGNFITLAGLETLIKRSETGEEPSG